MWDVANSVIELNTEDMQLLVIQIAPTSSGNTDFLILNLNINGELIWMKSYGNKAFPNHEWAYDIVQLEDNGYMVVGSRDRYSKLFTKNGLLIRLNNKGELIWEKS